MKTVMAYCLRCKKKTKIEDGRIVKMKNRINSVNAVKGICAQCGSKVSKIIGKSK